MRFVLIFAVNTLLVGAVGAQNSINEKMKALVTERPRVNPNSGDLELKLLTINQAIAETPQNPELLLKKGVYLQELGRTAQAIDVFESLRLSYPSHPAPYINLASAYAQQGNLEEARQMLVKSDSLYSGRYQTHLSLASINIGLALASVRKANELNPGDATTEKKIKDIEALLTKLNNPTGVLTAPIPLAAATAENLKKVAPVPSRSHRGKLYQAAEESMIVAKGDRLKLSALSMADVPIKEEGGAKPSPVVPDKLRSIDDDSKTEILNTVESWASAWSRRNYADYLSYYGSQFRVPSGINREAWAKNRQSVIEKTKFINVEVKIQKLQISGKTATVIVNQRYSSDIHSDFVRKELKLIFENGSWKIQAEKIIENININ